LPGYKWSPITPLSDQERTIDLAAIGALYESWKIAKEHYKEARKESFVYAQVEAQAHTRGVLPETLVNLWLLERLHERERT
jgi:hypothetical protein